MQLKTAIKKHIPLYLLNLLRKIINKMYIKTFYKYDAKRFAKHSNLLNRWDNPEKLIGQIVAEYHVIEKGLAMCDMRLGFGKEILSNLIRHCNLYARCRFDERNNQFIYALRVIAEYKFEHDKQQYELNKDLLESINNLLSNNEDITPSKQIEMTKADYFKFNQGSFEEFSNSRHSLRNFSGQIEIEKVEKSLSLAQNTPTSCNRQPQRVYIVQDKKQIKEILKIQSGNRGFGHLADILIIITVELGCFLSINERNDVYVNGGIYAMNLLYALHYYQIGACALNWCSTPKDDLALRSICEILPSETVILIIACGGVPDNFKVVASPRRDYTSIINHCCPK